MRVLNNGLVNNEADKERLDKGIGIVSSERTYAQAIALGNRRNGQPNAYRIAGGWETRRSLTTEW